MAETLAALLTAHLLGDFVFQTSWMVKRKRQAAVLLLHVLLVTGASFLLLGNLHWPTLLVIFAGHLGIDAVKAFILKDTLRTFLIDQGLHFALLTALACTFPNAAPAGWWHAALKGPAWNWYFASLSVLSGLILIVPAGGILIGKATAPFLGELGAAAIGGLENGGLYIGWLERLLVMLFVLIDQPTGIGFLIAAKSVLRFGEIKEASQRKMAEYIIIGTFLSFAWALLIAVLTQSAVRHWLPGSSG